MSGPRQGELYWIDPEPDRGGPGHPHLVVQDDLFNASRVRTVVVMALTSRLQLANEPGNVLLNPGEGGLPKPSVIVVSQVDSVPRDRLGGRIGALSPERVREALDGLRFVQRAFLGER